jgi:type IV pilus assembly protein PilM
MAKPIVTFDVGSSLLKMAVFVAERNRIQLTDFDVSPLASPAEASLEEKNRLLARQMKSILSAKKIKTDKIFVSISGQSVFTRFVKLPAVEEAKVTQIIRYEAQQQVPFPIEDVEWDYNIIGKTPTGEIDIVLVAAKNDIIRSFLQECRKAGIEVGVLDVAPLCVYNCLRHVEQEFAECTAVIDFGAKSANLIISEGDDLWARTVPIGGDSITSAIAKELNLDEQDAEKLKYSAWVPGTSAGEPEDATDEQRRASRVAGAFIDRMYAELARSIGFYRSQAGHSAVRRILLSGGSARLKFFGRFLSDRFKVDVGWLSPLDKIGVGRSLDRAQLNQYGHLLAGAVGLGLRGADMARIRINLIPKSLAVQRELSRKKKLLVAAGWLLVATFLIMAFGKKITHGDNSPTFDKLLNSVRKAAPGLLPSVPTLKKRKEELEALYNKEVVIDNKISTVQNDIQKVGEKIDAIAQVQMARLHWVQFIEDLKNTKAEAAGKGQRNYIWLTGLRITTNEMVAAEWATEIREARETGGPQLPSLYRPPSSSRTRKTTTSGPDTRPWVILTGFVKIPPEATGERSGGRATDRVEMFMNALDRMGERFECTRGHRFRLDEATGILYPVSPDTGPAKAYRFRWDEAASDIVLEGLISPGDTDLELILPPLEEEETEASGAAGPAESADGTSQPPTPATPSEPKPTEPAVQPKPPEATLKPPAAVTTPTAGASETPPAEVPAPPLATEAAPAAARPAGTGTVAPPIAEEKAPPAENWVELRRYKSRGRRPDWLIDGRIVGDEISICPIDYLTTEKLTKTVQTLGYLDEVYISEVETPLPGERVARFKILARLAEEFDYAKKSEML